jgi:integrase
VRSREEEALSVHLELGRRAVHAVTLRGAEPKDSGEGGADVEPTLGRLALMKLDRRHLQSLYAAKLREGLSPTTVRHLHTVIRRALADAVRWGLVTRNVADIVTAPRRARTEIRPLSLDQARAVLAAAEEDRLGALCVVALTSGMREGELLGLRWRDVDLGAGVVAVRSTLYRADGGLHLGEPKTARSRRSVHLTGEAVAALRRHRERQVAERLRLGPAWEDNDLVFASEVGRPVERQNMLRRSFHPLLRRAGVPRVRFHDLRHSTATLLLGMGVHPKIVSEILGHATVAITLDTYSHVTPAMHRGAAEAMSSLLRSADHQSGGQSGGQLPFPPGQQEADSYSESGWAGVDSNHRPQGYEPRALTG